VGRPVKGGGPRKKVTLFLRCDLRQYALDESINLSEMLEHYLIEDVKKSGKSLPQVE